MRAPSDLLSSNAPLVPLFVYGTLRMGGALHERYLDGEVVDHESATLTGFSLRDVGAFPLMVHEQGHTTYGEVMWMRPDSIGLHRAIHMELGAGYTMELVEVEVPSMMERLPVLAFVWNNGDFGASRVPLNDWMAT